MAHNPRPAGLPANFPWYEGHQKPPTTGGGTTTTGGGSTSDDETGGTTPGQEYLEEIGVDPGIAEEFVESSEMTEAERVAFERAQRAGEQARLEERAAGRIATAEGLQADFDDLVARRGAGAVDPFVRGGAEAPEFDFTRASGTTPLAAKTHSQLESFARLRELVGGPTTGPEQESGGTTVPGFNSTNRQKLEHLEGFGLSGRGFIDPAGLRWVDDAGLGLEFEGGLIPDEFRQFLVGGDTFQFNPETENRQTGAITPASRELRDSSPLRFEFPEISRLMEAGGLGITSDVIPGVNVRDDFPFVISSGRFFNSVEDFEEFQNRDIDTETLSEELDKTVEDLRGDQGSRGSSAGRESTILAGLRSRQRRGRGSSILGGALGDANILGGGDVR